jgi:hypothetical protein
LTVFLNDVEWPKIGSDILSRPVEHLDTKWKIKKLIDFFQGVLNRYLIPPTVCCFAIVLYLSDYKLIQLFNANQYYFGFFVVVS